MKSYRDTLIETATSDSELPPEFAQRLIEAAPWLDGTEEISADLAPDLLSDEANAFKLSQSKLSEFIERYNTLVQSTPNALAMRQSEAHLAMGQVLARYGRADAFGEGDYWLVSDSFSTRTPVVLVYGEFQLPSSALSKLQEVLNGYSGVFAELRINTEYGAEVATLLPR